VIKIGLSQARALALRAQGLAETNPFGSGPGAALRAIEHLGYVQIDTIAVVERAHHHVLWSRVPDYRPSAIDALIADRSVFEYWSHAAAYLPMRDYRFSLPRMRSFRRRLHWADDSPELRSAMRRVVARMRRDGPLKARDFDAKAPSPPGFWTFAKIEKRAMHELWMRGDIMVTAREGFQKVYDLTDRVLPPGLDRTVPSEAEMADHLIFRGAQAHGILREKEMRYLRGGALAGPIRRRLARAVREGRLVPVMVEGTDVPAYAGAESVENPPDAVESDEVRILSPFDNLVIQRERLRWLFGFDYQIECYVPAPKRKFGHFVLPLLWGDRFVGRLEAKAVRSERLLRVIGLWFEPGFSGNRTLRKKLEEALEQFAAFNGCQKWQGPEKSGRDEAAGERAGR
jgi:uncharacterized protein YcaQ